MTWREYECYGCPHLGDHWFCNKRGDDINNIIGCSYISSDKRDSYRGYAIFYDCPYDDKYCIMTEPAHFIGFDTREEAVAYIDSVKKKEADDFVDKLMASIRKEREERRRKNGEPSEGSGERKV